MIHLFQLAAKEKGGVMPGISGNMLKIGSKNLLGQRLSAPGETRTEEIHDGDRIDRAAA